MITASVVLDLLFTVFNSVFVNVDSLLSETEFWWIWDNVKPRFWPR
jgi:hypothetical protein